MRRFRVLAVAGLFALSACAAGTGNLIATLLPTPQPGTGTTSAASLACTTSGDPQSIARTPMNESIPRRAPVAPPNAVPASRIVEVTYARSSFARVRERTPVEATLDFPASQRVVQILRVDPAQAQSLVRSLRSSPLVSSVSYGAPRYAQSTNAASAFPNDPFFAGFAPGNVPPFYQTANTGGQWNDHVICAANAWAYGTSNTTGRTIASALGGTAPIAVVDTGADLSHPDLTGRVVYAETVLNGVVTPGIQTMHDNDGHGTDVAGIAAASANNGIGFAGVAYAAPLMVFKVFPDPPSGGCAPGSTSSKCTANGSDVAIAIGDAAAHGAKVINLSLGDTAQDTAEANAVSAAIAAGVVVVASSGNGSGTPAAGAPVLDYPAADPGVIAVGASAIDDTNPLAVGEKVASYSNYSVSNPSSWGVVAPGGDPSGSSDPDDLHWIENIYTSTAADGTSASACRPDPFASGPPDCRIFIAGTSQAAPLVSGAASLLLSAGAPAARIKTLLCASAVPIPGGRAGCGRLDVYKAMALAVGDPSP